jgi:antitoxin ParD1/3/4
MNVSLPESLRKFAEERAAKGYGSVSEYFRELLRDDQKRVAQERLEELLLHGLDSGEAVEVTPEYWKELRARVRKRAKKVKAAK